MVTRRRFLQASMTALLAPRLAPAAGGVLVCRPYLQNVRRTRATVRWMTREPGTASLGFVSQNGEPRVVPASTTWLPPSASGLEARFRHEAVLTGLQPGTDYTYDIRLEGKSLGAEGLAFRTAGAKGLSFVVIGDTGSGSAEQERLAAQLLREHPALVIHTGDLAYPSGTYETYQRHYFDYYHALMNRAPFYPTPGNHDYYEMDARPYLDLHDFPPETVAAAERGRYYTFEWADAQFFSVDSNQTLEAAAEGKSDMLAWLDRELEASRKFWRIVFLHHPPFASGAHDDDPLCALVRRHVTPILERHRVPMVFCGHEHSYQRSHPIGGVTYITTGGGGAILHEARPSKLTAAAISEHHYLRVEIAGRRMDVRAIGIDGGVLDVFRLEPAPVLSGPVVNSASFTASIGRGGLISIFGRHLSLETRDNGGRPIEDGAGDVRVSISGQALPLLMVSPSQVNAILPMGLPPGPAVVEVATAGGAARAEIEVLAAAPALFADTFVEVGSGLRVSAEQPVKPGATVQIFATGCAGWEGEAAVLIGGSSIVGRVAAGDIEGLSVVAFEVPVSLGRGVWPVRVEIGGVTSNAAPLAVG